MPAILRVAPPVASPLTRRNGHGRRGLLRTGEPKQNESKLSVFGQQFEQMLGEGGSNKYGTTKVFATEKLSRQEIIDYAQSLAGAVPLEEKKIPKGMVYFAKKDGVTINLREYSRRDEKKLAGLLI